MQKQLKEKLDGIFSSCKGVDKIYIRNTSAEDPNFTYLTGFPSGLFEQDIAVVDRKGLVLYVGALEYEDALRQKHEGMKIIEIGDGKLAATLLNNSLKGKTVGINEDFLPYANYKRIKARYKPKKIVDVSKSLLTARLVKGADEIENISKAVRITRKAMAEVHASLEERATEREIALKIDEISESLGSSEPSCKTIVCFGKNAALPHHSPDNTKLKIGDFVLIDAGAVVNNYHSDFARTFIFGNKNEVKDYDRKSEILNIVKGAQKAAIASIKPGVKGNVADKIATEYIDTAAKGKYSSFGYPTVDQALGHALGIEVHDGVGFEPRSEIVLQENMVFAIEPAIYILGFGGVRIEDDIVITKKGCKIL